MNVRIRYQNDGDGVLRSRRVFNTADGRSVTVELDIESKKYSVKDSVTGEVVISGGNTRNLSVLKIQAKNGLQSLGVEFSPEVRNR